ncbi:zinc finger protein 124-like [Anopheles bellator]|uniref:zinc finger protein 124-like n=1 Tax=Anopheles bellator TaxID=139047 RepID=UPI002648DA0C|nr:zinc finger protein 124-like [Anopheles bellator]
MCEARLEKMEMFRWRCNENNGLVDKFIEEQNKAKKASEISQNRFDHSAEQTVGTELSIKTEVTSSNTAKDLHLNQQCCTVHEANSTFECCGNQPFEAEENPITIKLEYVDVDEQYWLQMIAILDHEQDELQTNPLELVFQDREDHSMSKNMCEEEENHSMSKNICADGTKLSIKTEVTSPDTVKHLHLNQKCFKVHHANSTYQCCGKIPDDLFEAEENPIAIKSEYEEVDKQHQLQITNGLPLDSICQDQKDYPVTVADNTRADDSAAESTQNVLSPGTRKVHSKSHSKNHKHHCKHPHCFATYPNLYNLKIHIRTHTGERPYQCKVCDKAFYSASHLREHSKTHNKDQQHQCPHCSLTFTQSAKLKIHIRTHTGERPYQCKVCDKAFCSSANLSVHSKIHHKNQQHQCPYCSLKFPWLYSLKNHIRTHTGERPYVCKVCGEAFHSSQVLGQHSKIHNKDHQCPHCSLKFPRLYQLGNHIHIHAGKKPYQCKVCDKAFKTSNKLAEHSKIHKKDEPY